MSAAKKPLVINVEVSSIGAWSSSSAEMIASEAMQRQLTALKELANRYPTKSPPTTQEVRLCATLFKTLRGYLNEP